MSGLFGNSDIGPGPFQGLFHFLYGDQGGVIIDPVDLLEVLESLFDSLYPLQPLQGRFPHIISLDKKGDHGEVLALGRHYVKPRNKKEEY